MSGIVVVVVVVVAAAAAAAAAGGGGGGGVVVAGVIEYCFRYCFCSCSCHGSCFVCCFVLFTVLVLVVLVVLVVVVVVGRCRRGIGTQYSLELSFLSRCCHAGLMAPLQVLLFFSWLLSIVCCLFFLRLGVLGPKPRLGIQLKCTAMLQFFPNPSPEQKCLFKPSTEELRSPKPFRNRQPKNPKP